MARQLLLGGKIAFRGARCNVQVDRLRRNAVTAADEAAKQQRDAAAAAEATDALRKQLEEAQAAAAEWQQCAGDAQAATAQVSLYQKARHPAAAMQA